jgi:hypothetical protein
MNQQSIKKSEHAGMVDFENYLSSALQPVTPNPVYVSAMQEHLLKQPPVVAGLRSALKVYTLVAFGCFSGLFLVWILRRIWGNKR